MLYIPGCAAAICHAIVLLIGGVFNKNAYDALGYSDRDTMRNSDDVNTLVAVTTLQFMPTFTLMCFGFSWLCCAYHSEAGAYCMVAAPVAYGVLWLMWVFSRIGRDQHHLFPMRCCGADDHVDPTATMTRSERAMYRNQLREQRSYQQAITGGLRGSNWRFHETAGSSLAEAMAAYDDGVGGALEGSPYLEARARDGANEVALRSLKRQNAERQRQMNKAFEVYREQVARGEEVGPFVFEGEVIPTDKRERRRLEAIHDSGEVALYL